MPSATDSQQGTSDRGVVDKNEIGRVVRSAAETVYGVAGIGADNWRARLTRRLGGGPGGVTVDAGQRLSVSIDLRVAPDVPAARVATNVVEKVRYDVQRDLGLAIDELIIRVGDTVVEAIDEPH